MSTTIQPIPQVKLHVFPFLDHWAIFEEADARPKGEFFDPRDALKSARKMLKRHPAKTRVFVHNKEGKLQSILDDVA